MAITRGRACVLRVILFSIAVVKSHQRVTFMLLSDVHLGKSHLSCCCKVGKFLILRDAQREMLKFPLEPHPSPAAFQWMSLPVQNKALQRRGCWGSVFDALLSVNVLSKLPGWIQCLPEPQHCSSRTPEELSAPQK